MDYIALGQRIRELRRQSHLTQAQLAEKTGVSTSYIGHIERGSRVLSMETFVQLCIALNTDPNTLLNINSECDCAEPLTPHQKELLDRLMDYGVQLARSQ